MKKELLLPQKNLKTLENLNRGNLKNNSFLKLDGKIQPMAKRISPSSLRTKRKRIFKKHAKPWEFKDYKTMTLGESVQIAHMTVTKNEITFKYFQAWERKSKYIQAALSILMLKPQMLGASS